MKRPLPLLTALLIFAWISIYYYLLDGLGLEDKRQMLMALGAHARAPILENGEVWRLLSSTLLHHSVFHLWSNVAGLLIIGFFLEPQVNRISFLALTFLSAIVPMGDAVFLTEGIMVGGSVIVYGWAGAAFGFGFKNKTLLKQWPFLLALMVYLCATLWIGAHLSSVAHRPHVIALALGFVAGHQMFNLHTQRWLSGLNVASAALAVMMVLCVEPLREQALKEREITFNQTGLHLSLPSFWSFSREGERLEASNGTDAVFWAFCEEESKPQEVDAVVADFLSGQLLWPQTFGDVSDVKFEIGQPNFVPKSEGLREGVRIPFSFVGTQGGYEGDLRVWVFGLYRCSLVSSRWRYGTVTSQKQLQGIWAGLQFLESRALREQRNAAQQNLTDGSLAMGAAQLAFALGEEAALQQLFTQIEKHPSEPPKGYDFLRAKHALITLQDQTEAKAWALKALEATPEDREVVLLAAGLLLHSGDVMQARQILMHAHILSGEFDSWLEKTRWLKP